MYKNSNSLNILKLCYVICLWSASIAIAQQSSGGDFSIAQYTIDNGGGVSQGGQFSLTGMIAQAEADRVQASGTVFNLRGGFWLMFSGDLIFKNSFEAP